MDQLTLGEERAQQGMDSAVAGTHQGVVRMVDDAIRVMSTRYARFTADHVRQLCELEWGIKHVDIGRVIGARMNSAGRRGEIRSNGMTVKSSRPDAHARRLLVWEKVA